MILLGNFAHLRGWKHIVLQ